MDHPKYSGIVFSVDYPEVIFYIIIFISISYILYKLYFVYRQIKHWFYNVRNGNLLVRNSPLDKFSSQAARLIWCSKIFCEVAAPIGIMYGGMSGIVELRKAKGYEPLFLPFLADLVLPDNEVSKLYKENQKLGAQLISNNKESSLISQERSLVEYLRENKILTNNESSEWESHKKK